MVLAAVVAGRRVVEAGLLALGGLVPPGLLEPGELWAAGGHAAGPLQLLLLADPGHEGRGHRDHTLGGLDRARGAGAVVPATRRHGWSRGPRGRELFALLP